MISIKEYEMIAKILANKGLNAKDFLIIDEIMDNLNTYCKDYNKSDVLKNISENRNFKNTEYNLNDTSLTIYDDIVKDMNIKEIE